jgi:hypothetical protein
MPIHTHPMRLLNPFSKPIQTGRVRFRTSKRERGVLKTTVETMARRGPVQGGRHVQLPFIGSEEDDLLGALDRHLELDVFSQSSERRGPLAEPLLPPSFWRWVVVPCGARREGSGGGRGHDGHEAVRLVRLGEVMNERR